MRGFLAFFSPGNLQDKCSYLEDVSGKYCSTDQQDLTSARSTDLERQRQKNLSCTREIPVCVRKCGERSARKKRGNPGRAGSKSISSVAKWPFVRINDYRKIIRERVAEKRNTQLVWTVLGVKKLGL